MRHNKNSFSCGCRRCVSNREAVADARAALDKENGRGNAAEITGLAVSAAMNITGMLTDPGQGSTTDQLSDAHASQVEGYRSSITDASNSQGTDTSGSSGRGLY